MALFRDNQPLACFATRFLLLPARSFPDHNLNASGVIQGDEEIGRKYEVDNSYGLLGTRGKSLAHRACWWAWIAHGIWRWTWNGRFPG